MATPTKPFRFVIIGGGISGLAAAYRLARSSQPPSKEILLLEASDKLGGSLQTTARDGFLLEQGPDCFISNKPGGLPLCRELGLEPELIGTRPEYRRSFIVRDGQFHPVPEGFYLLGPSKLRPFLESSLLSWRGKWRALMEPFIPHRHPRSRNRGSMDSPLTTAGNDNQKDESLASFVRRRFGSEMLDWLAQPLLGGIYAADPETLSLQATFPQFLEMEARYGSVLVGLKKKKGSITTASGARYSLFVSFRKGMHSLINALQSHLPDSALRLKTSVQSIHRTSERNWEIRLTSGENIMADAVCIALPAYHAADLLGLAAPSLSRALQEIPYSHSTTLNLAYRTADIRNPLGGVGYVCPQIQARPAMACTWVHHKFVDRVPHEHALLRTFIGGTHQQSLWERDDRDLEKQITDDLAMLFGISQAPRFTLLQRWPRAMPQYVLGHRERLLRMMDQTLEHPRLALAGNWQWGVGIPDCIESGARAAASLLAYAENAQHMAGRENLG